jgi:hypothetical protein
MLYVLADTSVWLDLAKTINGQKLIVAVRVLVHERRLKLLVPRLVIEEFERNRERAACPPSSAARAKRSNSTVRDQGARRRWTNSTTCRIASR